MGQLLGIQKSESLKVTTGGPIWGMERAMIAPWEKSLVGLIVKVLDRLGNKKGSREKE